MEHHNIAKESWYVLREEFRNQISDNLLREMDVLVGIPVVGDPEQDTVWRRYVDTRRLVEEGIEDCVPSPRRNHETS